MEGFKCCVTNVFPQSRYSYEDLQSSLSLLAAEAPAWLARCSPSNKTTPPCILGEWIPRADGSFSPHQESRNAGIWFVVTNTSSSLLPSLHLLLSCGCMHRTSCIFIQYSTTSAYFAAHTMAGDAHMKYTLYQIASAQDLESCVQRHRQYTSGNADDIDDSGIHVRAVFYMYACIVRMLLLFSRVQYLVSRWSLEQLETPLLVRSIGLAVANYTPRWMRNCSPRDLSLTAAQLCHRYRSSLAIYYMVSSNESQDVPAATLQLFLSLASRCLFMCIDAVAGATCGAVLWMYKHEAIAMLHEVCDYIDLSILRAAFDWFRSNPYGIKLNAELATRIATLLLSLLEGIKCVYAYLSPIEMPMLLCISCMGCLGLTYQLLFFADIARLLCLPIAIIHQIFSALHKIQISCLYTLSLLFQGRKQNILRQRIDTCTASHQQLVTSTIIFAGIIFLLPTFAAYYLLFLTLQIGVVALLGCLWGASVAFKELPVFSLLCRVFKPNYFVTGFNYVVLSPILDKSNAAVPTSSSRGIARRLTPRRNFTTTVTQQQPQTRFDDCFLSDSSSDNSGGDSDRDDDLLGLGILSDDSCRKVSDKTAATGSSSEDNGANKAMSGGSVITFKKTLIYSEENKLMAAKAKMRRLAEEMQQHRNNTGNNIISSPSTVPSRLKTAGLSRKHHNSRATQSAPVSVNATNMVYVRLVPQYASLFSLFQCYSPYITYFLTRKFASRIFRGVFFGRPAMDLQLIRASIDITTSSSRYCHNIVSALDVWTSFQCSVTTAVNTNWHSVRNANEDRKLRYVSIALLLISDFLCVLICSVAAVVFIAVFLQHANAGWQSDILWQSVAQSNNETSHLLLPLHVRASLSKIV